MKENKGQKRRREGEYVKWDIGQSVRKEASNKKQRRKEEKEDVVQTFVNQFLQN